MIKCFYGGYVSKTSRQFKANKHDLTTPVAARVDARKLAELCEFMDRLAVDNRHVAMLEYERLQDYFAVFHDRLLADIKSASLSKQDKDNMKQTDFLRDVFNRMADRTGSTVLSEFVIAPQSFVDGPKGGRTSNIFTKKTHYKNHSITLGFVQIKDPHGESANSLPLVGLDDKITTVIAEFNADKLLQSLQYIFTAANHDMQHHLSNELLNSEISLTFSDRIKAKGYVEKPFMKLWGSNQFPAFGDDRHIASYESYLILNHARIWQGLKGSDQEKQLENACNTFFDELERMTADMQESAMDDERISPVIDYMGMILNYALVRFLPLDHPIFDSNFDRLKQIDPNAMKDFVKKADDLFTQIEFEDYILNTIENFSDAGVDLRFEHMRASKDYNVLKKLELAAISPEFALLNSPANPGSDLDKVKKKISQTSLEMIHAAALDVNMAKRAGNPIHSTTLYDEKIIQHFDEDGALHHDTKAAYQSFDSDGDLTSERWFKHGARHRDGGPAEIYNTKDRSYKSECYYQNDVLHRTDGPAHIEHFEKHSAYKYIHQGVMIGLIETSPDGRVTHIDWKNPDHEFSAQYKKHAENKFKLRANEFRAMRPKV